MFDSTASVVVFLLYFVRSTLKSACGLNEIPLGSKLAVERN